MNRHPYILQAAAAAALLTLSTATFAQTTAPDPQKKATAEALYRQALKLMEQKSYAVACPKLVESQRLDPVSNTLIALASCYDKGGKTASAWTLYQDLVVVFKKLGNADGAKAAQGRVDDLEKKLSKLQISITSDTPGLIVRRDGQDVATAVLGTPVAVDPGQHVIEATAPGYEVWQTTVTVGDKNDVRTVTIPGLTAKPVPKNALRPAAFAVGGVGAAGLIVGGIFGGLALGSKSTLTKECPNSVCNTQAGKDARASAGTQALVSTVSLSVGGAALATGVVLFVLSTRGGAPKSDDAPKTSLVPSFGPGGGGLTLVGSF